MQRIENDSKNKTIFSYPYPIGKNILSYKPWSLVEYSSPQRKLYQYNRD